MKLYEINEAIERLADQLTVDEETGEICCDFEKICADIESLKMEKKSVLEYLAKLVLNIRSESAAIKAEEARLHDRRTGLEKKENRLLQVLDRECGGEKTDLGVATLCYRKTSHVDVSDPSQAVDWLKSQNMTYCYRVPEPEVSKAEVKKLLASGTQIPGCSLKEERSYSLR